MRITTSLAATAAAGITLGLAELVTDVPTPLWIAWAALGVVAVAQTARGHRGTAAR